MMYRNLFAVVAGGLLLAGPVVAEDVPAAPPSQAPAQAVAAIPP